MISRPVSFLVYFFITTIRVSAADASTIDPAFDKEVASFKAEADSRRLNLPWKNLKVLFAEKEVDKDGSLGICYMGQSLTAMREVYILRSFWDSASPAQRERLIYHELSHCLLNRDHCNKENHNYKYVSWMVEWIDQDTTFDRPRQYYVKELFKHANGCDQLVLKEQT